MVPRALLVVVVTCLFVESALSATAIPMSGTASNATVAATGYAPLATHPVSVAPAGMPTGTGGKQNAAAMPTGSASIFIASVMAILFKHS